MEKIPSKARWEFENLTREVEGLPEEHRRTLADALQKVSAALDAPPSSGGPPPEGTERYWQIFSHMTCGAAVYEAVEEGRDFRVVEFNEAAERISGLPREEAVGRTITQLFPSVEETGLLEVFRRVRETGVSEHHPVSRCRGRRLEVWVESSVYRLPSGEIVAVFEDRTQLRRAEEEARAAERLAPATLDALSAHICILGSTGTILQVNRSWRQFAEENAAAQETVSEGANYLAVCDSARGADAETAAAFAAGIRSVLARECHEFAMEYPCHSPQTQRWFIGRVTRLPAEGPTLLAVAHENITARRCAEEALRKSQERYRAVVEDQTELIGRFKPDGTLIFVNEASCRFLGKRREEVEGSRWQPAVVPEDLPGVEEPLGALSPADPVVTIVNRVVAGSGEARWMEFVNRGIFDEEGRLAEILFVGRDVTERMNAEEAARASEEKFAKAFYAAPNLMAITTAEEGRIEEINNAFCQVLGYAREECIGRTTVELAIWVDPEQRAGVLRKIEAEGRAQSVDVDVRTKSGENRSVVLSMEPINVGGRSRLLSVATDVTERKRAEEKLREGERRFRGIIENVQDAYFQADLAGRLTMASPSAARMYGYASAEEMLGLPAESLYHDPARRREAMEILAREGRVQDVVGHAARKDGTVFWVSLNAQYCRDTTGNIVGTEGFVRDITDRMRTEQDLQKSQRRLESLSRQLVQTREAESRRIARELHDDVGQLLTVAKIGLERDQRGRRTPSTRTAEALEAVDAAIKHLRQISSDLHPSMLDDLGLVPALRWFLDRHGAQASFATSLSESLGDGRLPATTELACFRIAQEALTNARRHAAARSVEVDLAMSGGDLVLLVRDDGAGFDVAAAMKSALRSQSLGLLSMQERAALAGGRLEIRSARGRGTEIEAHLPLGEKT